MKALTYAIAALALTLCGVGASTALAGNGDGNGGNPPGPVNQCGPSEHGVYDASGVLHCEDNGDGWHLELRPPNGSLDSANTYMDAALMLFDGPGRRPPAWASNFGRPLSPPNDSLKPKNANTTDGFWSSSR